VNGTLSMTTALAHDFFVVPKTFLSQEMTVDLDATISAAFPAPENTVAADRIAGLQVLSTSRNARAEIAGASEKTLRVRLQDAGRGVSVVALQTVSRDIEYAEDRIDLIMGEYEVAPEAADAVRALSRPRTLRVSSTRVAKTYVCVADCSDRSATTRATVGGLEFVSADAKDEVSFRLQLNGSPLPDYPIAIVLADGSRQRARTDASCWTTWKMPPLATPKTPPGRRGR